MQPPCRTESQLCAKRVIPFCTRWFEGQQWIDYFIPSFWALQTFFSQPRQVGFAVRLRRQRFTKRWKDTTSRPWAPRVLADVVQIGSTHVDPQNTFQQSVLTVVGNSPVSKCSQSAGSFKHGTLSRILWGSMATCALFSLVIYSCGSLPGRHLLICIFSLGISSLLGKVTFELKTFRQCYYEGKTYTVLLVIRLHLPHRQTGNHQLCREVPIPFSECFFLP